MTETNFRVRPYSKRELARLYFPGTARIDSAVVNLRNLMKRNPDLMDELEKTRYKPHDKGFTPKQVAAIVRYLGEP